MKAPDPLHLLFPTTLMSDTAIFLAATDEELRSTNGLPGDLNNLRALPSETERIVHFEFLTDKPAPERLLNALNQSGLLISILPGGADPTATLVSGLMTRLHEFICAYPNISQFILAGIYVDRLAPAATFLQRAGYSVVLCGPDRSRLESVRFAADDTEVWGSGGGRGSRTERSASSQDREERPAADPFEVLVEEVTKSRKRGHRVLLTSLKQRMRKRIRRFDETRLKDKDGRPMRKFKDFIVDAANRGLIQLIEKGNLSHVLLPDESPDADTEEESAEVQERGDGEDGDTNGVDPLLDTVDVVGEAGEDDDDSGDSPEEADEEAEAEEVAEVQQPLSPEDIDAMEIDEDVAPPPAEFLEALEEMLKTPKTLEDLVGALVEKYQTGEGAMKTRTLRDQLQAAFNNELLEPADEEKPVRYSLVDDWRDIIDYL